VASESSRKRPSLRDLGAAGDAGATAHYEDPAYYRTTYRSRQQDVDYYLKLGKKARGPVLEYGIGNGRVALPLARAGVEVMGIDLSGAMLDDLKQQLAAEPPEVRARLSWRRGDMRSVRLERRFALVIAPFNTILHLYERRDVERFLARVREHLAPRGQFVFDFSIPHPPDLSLDPERSYGAPRFRHPSTGELTRYSERFEYDGLRQLLLIHMQFRPEGKAAPIDTPLTHRQFFPREMEALLHYNGFRRQTWSADFSDEPPTAGSDSLVVSCR
jgi:SAM-dependent methyltransferase